MSSRAPTSAALVVGALGIVYGDIGTSPLYALGEALYGHSALPRTPESVFGVLSLAIWSLVIVVMIKYVVLILRADNDGEGGIFALLGLLLKAERTNGLKLASWIRRGVFAGVVMGAALLFGDGIITPAISVLSAVEGLSSVSPSLSSFPVPVALAIILGLFLIQHNGTHRIARFFGPFMMVWFLAIAVLGLLQIVAHPEILKAVNPLYALRLVRDHGWNVLFVMGSVVLCVTGVEAMYADLGHFGRLAISRSWTFFVFPCLLLNYIGQGAYALSGGPVQEQQLFYAIVPQAILIPMVALATGAAIIASQALISGVFSLTQQATALGLFPRLKIVHTNPHMEGQIYVPFVNTMLLLGCLLLVMVFKDSSALGAAYGIAVTGTMVITTLVFTLVAVKVFGWRKRLLLPLVAAILLVDLAYFSANLLKFKEGGYVPILIGLILYLIMDTWQWGRSWVGLRYREQYKDEHQLTVKTLIEHKPQYFEATGSVSLVVMASRPILDVNDTVPPVMAVHYRNWRRLPKHIIFFSVVQLSVPVADEETRYQTQVFTQDAYGTVVSVQVRYGYMEQVNVRQTLLRLKNDHLIKVPLDPRRWLVLIGAERFVTAGKTWRERWRLGLFSRLNRLAKPITDYFGLEHDSAVITETINV